MADQSLAEMPLARNASGQTTEEWMLRSPGDRSRLAISPQEKSRRRFRAVFGYQPDKPPVRPWLRIRHQTYAHIADIWQHPDLRASVLRDLKRRYPKLHDLVADDFEYYDECERRFASLRRGEQ
jgi:hypothetical protein